MPDPKIYSGMRDRQNHITHVHVKNKQDGSTRTLKPIPKHSPTGFEWGYLGSGPAELAYCILLDFTHNKSLTEQIYQQFKQDVIGRIRMDAWTLTCHDILTWFTSTYDCDNLSETATIRKKENVQH